MRVVLRVFRRARRAHARRYAGGVERRAQLRRVPSARRRCFAIMPWNFPYWQVFRAAAPALMAGNAMVLKHADAIRRAARSRSNALHAKRALRTDCFRTLLISHDEADARIADERIAAVTLTGSERAGVAVARRRRRAR